jgi:glycogen debranching enzyme
VHHFVDGEPSHFSHLVDDMGMDDDTRLGETPGDRRVVEVPLDVGQPSAHAYLRLAPARTPSIANSLVLKDGDLFLLSEPSGDVPLGRLHAAGLYYHDCRFLDGYELRVAGHPLEVLVSTAGRGYQSLVELTNPELISPGGEVVAHLETIGVTWTRTLEGSAPALYDIIAIRNFGHRRVVLPLTLAFHAGFQDVFSVRSLDFEPLGTVRLPRAQGPRLDLEYLGEDGIERRVAVVLAEPPERWDRTTAYFSVTLDPREQRDISLAISLSEAKEPGIESRPRQPLTSHDTLLTRHTRSEEAWRSEHTTVRSSSPLLDAIMDRSFRDLYLLRSSLDGQEYFAAGVPWFATLFGRDSIISALQMLAFDAGIARQTLRVLSSLQGRVCDKRREEQPGKILHELRVGELARTGRVPHRPYYGSIDATPLFLILVAEFFAWTGDRATIEHLRPHIDAAMAWLGDNADCNGYLTYTPTGDDGLFNQGWKDSDIGIPNSDGRPAQPPIALVEVQAYSYLARVRLAGMFQSLGEPELAEQLHQEAAALRRRFERDFWMESRGCYALALQKGGGQVAVCSSNAGHVLWTGIASKDRARRTRKRLMRPDMFSGWGVRTLSQGERAYSPVGYHVGTVWPHDNSLVLAGFRQYGFDQAALRIFSGMTEAAMHFELYRLPELFAGFSRADYEVPVHYPLASKPQAWAAGAIPYMLTSLLGLRPETDAERLGVVRPVLPESVDWLELNGLWVGSRRADLRFERTRGGVAVQVRRKDQPLEILVEL